MQAGGFLVDTAGEGAEAHSLDDERQQRCLFEPERKLKKQTHAFVPADYVAATPKTDTA